MTTNVRKALELLRAKVESDPTLRDALDRVEAIEALLGVLDDNGDARLRLPYSSDPPPHSERWKMLADA